MILLDEPTHLEPSRGMRICSRCHSRSLRLVETESHNIPAARGEIAATRTYTCTANGCGVTFRFLDVCEGEVSKRSVRSSPDHYGEPSNVAVETDEKGILLKI